MELILLIMSCYKYKIYGVVPAVQGGERSHVKVQAALWQSVPTVPEQAHVPLWDSRNTAQE